MRREHEVSNQKGCCHFKRRLGPVEVSVSWLSQLWGEPRPSRTRYVTLGDLYVLGHTGESGPEAPDLSGVTDGRVPWERPLGSGLGLPGLPGPPASSLLYLGLAGPVATA